MANGELNTSLKEVNDMIGKIDSSVNKLSNNWHKFLSEKPNLSALQAIVEQYKQLGDLQIELSKHSGSGSGIQRGNMKRLGENMVDNTEKIRAQLQKLGVDASTVGGTVGVSFATMASDITRAMQTIGKSVDLTQTSNDKLNTAAQKLAEEFRKAAEKAMSEKAVDASKIIKTGVGQVGTTEATRGFQKIHDAARLGLQPSEVNVEFVGAYQQAYAELLAKQQKAIDKQREFDAEFSKGKQQTSAIAGVVENYDKWEQKLAQLEKEQMELNVKQEAGVISAREAASEQSRIIREQREAKENIARINKTTEQAEREMTQKQTADIRRLNDLWNDNRRIRTRINEIESKPVDERTASENTLLKTLNDTLTIQKDELKQLQTQYRGVAEAQHVFSEQAIKDLENQIKAERDLAKQNAPKVSLGSTTGDVTTVSGAYRTQIKLYEEENRLLREQQAIRKELQNRSITDADEKHIESIDKRLQQIKKDRESIANTQLFKSASDQAKLDYAAKQTGEIRRRTNEATMATAAWAKENARVATTYQQLKFAADNIRNVLQNTELTKNEARQLSNELKRIEKKIRDCDKQMGIFNNSSKGLVNTVSQLAQGFGIMFSLQSVSQFARKIVEIRGEFELQEVALKAIVQDSLMGQQIWNETVQNALKSPFSVKQLVTYTKQLAAYRIETDKLTDTTKRLADISAGLGVDMQRLILAYGQVKAAAYLRASEVRQFTEAGINMYGELSKYFSEIEGRAVSTADVVERVSKRMVSFEDVAEVFKRLTDEGGVFYNMQEIQSETVRGQVMKLRDAFDIMLNDIGETSQGTIKDIVSLLLNMTRNWKEIVKVMRPVFDYFLMFKVVIPILKSISIAISNVETRMALALERVYSTTTGTKVLNAALKTQGLTLKSINLSWLGFKATITAVNAAGVETTRTMSMLSLSFKTLVVGIKNIGRAFSALWKGITAMFASNPVGWILAIGMAIYQLYNKIKGANDEIRKFNENLDKSLKKNEDDIEDSVSNFKRLADAITKTAKTEEERNEAYNSLRAQYAEILPAYMLEIGYLESITDGYKAAEAAIRNYKTEKARQEAIENVKNDMSNEIETDREDIAEAIRGEGFMRGDNRDASGNTIEFTNTQSERIASQFKAWMDDMLDQGKVATYQEAWSKLQEIVTQTTGKILDPKISEQNGKIDINIRDLIDDYSKLVGQVQTVNARFDESTVGGQYVTQINDLREQIKAEQAKKNGGNDATIQGYEKQIESLENKVEKLKTLQDFEEDAKQKEEELAATINSYNTIAKKVVALKETQRRIAELEAKTAEERTDAEKAELERLKEQEKYGINIAALAEKNAEFFGVDNDETVHDAIEMQNIAIEKQLALYDEQAKTLANKREELQNEYNSTTDDAYKTALAAVITEIEKKQEDLVKKSSELGQDWAKAWNDETEKSIKALEIDKTNSTLRRYVNELAVTAGSNAKKVGETARKNQKEIQEQIEMYERILAKSGKEMAESITGVTADILPALKELQKLSKERADEILGPEKNKGGHGRDPFNDRLNVLKEMFSEARKLNKELYGTAVSADKIVTQYKKAFEAAFGKTSGNRKANALWTEVQRQLEKNWNGGENTQQLVEALRKMKESGFVNKKNMPAFEKFLSQMEVEVTLSDRKDSREKFKKDFDQWMSDLNLYKELEKMGTPVEFYELFGLKKDDQTVAVIRNRVEDYYNTLRDANGKLGDEDAKQREETLRKLADMEDKEKKDRMKTYLKYVMAELNEVEKAYYEFEHARNEINKAFAGEDEEMVKARENALLGANKEFQKKIAKTRWNDLKSSDMYTMLFSDLDNIADETLNQMKKTLVDFLNEPGIKQNLTSSELRHIQEQLDKIDQLEQKRHPFKYLADDFNVFWKQLSQGARSNAIEKQRAQLEKVAKMRLEYQRLEARVGEAKASAGDGFKADAAYQAAKKAADEYEEQLREQERQLDDDTRAVNSFRQAQERLATSLEKAGNDLKAITNAGTSLYTNWMKMTSRMNQANDQVVASINQMANDIGDAIGNIAKIIASEGSDVTAWIGLVASIGSIISDGIDIHEATLDKEIKELDKKLSNISRRIELFEKQMDRAMSRDDYFDNYNKQMNELSAKLSALQEQYNAEAKKKNPDSEALEGYRASMDEVYEEQRALREKMTQEWGGIGESSWRSASEEFVDAWMQAFQETGDGLSGLQDNFDEFVKNLFKKQATMRIANMMLQPLFDMIDQATEDGTFTRSELDAVRQRAAQIFPELNEALKGLWEELGVGMDATDTLSGLQQSIQGITEATAEVIEGYLNSIRFFIAEDNMMLRQIRDAVLSGTQSASYAILSRIDENVRRIWDKLSDITMPNQTANTMAVRIVA